MSLCETLDRMSHDGLLGKLRLPTVGHRDAGASRQPHRRLRALFYRAEGHDNCGTSVIVRGRLQPIANMLRTTGRTDPDHPRNSMIPLAGAGGLEPPVS